MLKNLFSIYCESAAEAERLIKNAEGFGDSFEKWGTVGGNAVFSAENEDSDFDVVSKGDNLKFMLFLLAKKEMAGKVRLIYIDPPFFSSSKYESVFNVGGRKLHVRTYSDVWKGMDEYLKMLCTRLIIAKELLSDDGSLWLHMDWHAVHYVKVLMDEIFGAKNFINEVIWTYKSGGSTNRRFARKHDTLLFYGKTKDYYFNPVKEKSYNRGFKPYRFKGVEEFEDENGWYTLVNRKDVWFLDMVGRTSKERTGYATQKPSALIKQIIESCTEPGDICADFFSGSGVLAKAAKSMDRRFISCDIEKLSLKEHITWLVNEEGDIPATSVYIEREDDLSGYDGTLKVSVSDGSEGEIAVEIEKYEAGSSVSSLRDEDALYVEKLRSGELIECWYAACGKAEAVATRNEKSGMTDTVISLEPYDSSSDVTVIVLDVFGNIVKRHVIR